MELPKKHLRTIAILTESLFVILVFLCCFGAPKIVGASLVADRIVEGAVVMGTEIIPQASASLSRAFGNVGKMIGHAPEYLSQTRAGLADIWESVTCLFGFCETEKELPITNSQIPTDDQSDNDQTPITNSQKNPVSFGAGGTENDAAADTREEAKTNTITAVKTEKANSNTNTNTTTNTNTNTNIPNSTDTLLSSINRQLGGIAAKLASLASITTVTNVDQETKDKVNKIIKQLNSDRYNYSAGQVVSPSQAPNLGGDTLSVGGGSFTINESGDTIANNLAVQGSFTLSGTQTSTNTAAFAAASEDPILTLTQSGTGYALLADNIALKGSTISTSDSEPLYLFDSRTSMDENGNLTAGGNITPYENIAQDLGSPEKYFNNIYSKTIYTAAINTSGQGVFNYPPASAAYADSALLVNPTTAPENSILLGIGVAGSPMFTVDAEGDITVGGSIRINNDGGISANDYNGLALTSQTAGFTVSGGTASKTLTLNDDLNAATINAHIANTENPHNVTQAQVGLGDVENTALSTWPGTSNIATLGTVTAGTWNGTVISPQYGGTGVANDSANTLTFSGNYPLALTLGNDTNVTLPASGTLATLDGAETLSNKTLTAPVIAVLVGSKIYPASDSTTALQFTKADGSTSVMNIDTTNGRVGIGTTSPGATLDVRGNVAAGASGTEFAVSAAGAVTAGTWNGTVISPQYGGTGVANDSANTLTFAGNYPLALTLGNSTSLTLPTTGTVTALGNTTTGSGNVVLQTSPSLTTPSLGAATATSINKLAITAPATSATLTIADGKTFTAGNTMTLTGNDGASLAIGAGGTLGSGAYATIADYATLANPVFTGTVTIPGPFTLGATSVTASGAHLNYLAAASGITGTANLVFSDSPTLVTPVLGAASATSLSTPTLTTASGDLTLDPTGNVVIKGSTADNSAAALNVTNSTPSSLLFARNDGNVGINNILPGRKLDITETTGATPQIRLSYDSANYGEIYVDSVGNLFMDATGSAAQNISIMDQNLKVCTGGSFGSNTCPTSGFNITGTGNLVVAGDIVAEDYQKICPDGYIWVPGSAKYGTMPGFCAMKYEAKDAGGGVAASQASGTPWTSVNQETARAACRALGAGYHLISEAEWMTIAENAANTASNWFGGTVGTNFMYSGHNDNGPAGRLAASTDDDGYYGTNDSTSSCDGVYNNFVAEDDTTSGRACAGQRRTFTLSNGNVIWDISGNVWEWTDAYIYDSDGTHEMPLPASGWIEYTAVTDYKGLNYIRPQDMSWSATQSVGRLYADPNCAYSSVEGNDTCGVGDHYYHAFLRGGVWNDGAYAGAFALRLRYAPSGVYSYIGFRCAR